jgi:hypothetical protein
VAGLGDGARYRERLLKPAPTMIHHHHPRPFSQRRHGLCHTSHSHVQCKSPRLRGAVRDEASEWRWVSASETHRRLCTAPPYVGRKGLGRTAKPKCHATGGVIKSLLGPARHSGPLWPSGLDCEQLMAWPLRDSRCCDKSLLSTICCRPFCTPEAPCDPVGRNQTSNPMTSCGITVL